MAEKGYRLIRTGKLLYEFEKCKPGQVQYCVEFIGQKSKANAEDYHDFLEEMGYSVFYKNINLNYSVGKIRWRPWAEIGGRVATNTTTFNRELLIVEKENDGNLLTFIRPMKIGQIITVICEIPGFYQCLCSRHLLP